MSNRMTKYRKLKKQIESGDIIKISKGLYAKPEDLIGLEGDFYRATLLCGRRSAICLGSALQYYGLSERLSGKTIIMISHSSSPPKDDRVKAIRTRNPRWKIGVHKKTKYNITTVERSIVDAFRYSRLIGINEAIYALKISLKERQTTKAKIYDMARSLKACKPILPYLEAL